MCVIVGLNRTITYVVPFYLNFMNWTLIKRKSDVRYEINERIIKVRPMSFMCRWFVSKLDVHVPPDKSIARKERVTFTIRHILCLGRLCNEIISQHDNVCMCVIVNVCVRSVNEGWIEFCYTVLHKMLWYFSALFIDLLMFFL